MAKMRTTICFVGILILASGCNVGPDFRKPAPPPMPPKYVAETEPEVPTDEDLTAWWSNFNDPVLDDLIHQSVASNLDLREACFRIVEARAQRGVVSGELWPQFDGNALYAFRQLSENGRPFAFGNLSPNFDFYLAGFDAVWQLDVFGKIRRSIEASDAQVELSIESYRDVLVILLSDVASNYVSARTVQRQIETVEANLASQQKTLDLVERRHRAGVVSELDVAQARSNVYTTATTLPKLQQELQVAINRLSILTGEGPSREMTARVGLGPIPTGASNLGVGVPANLLRRRPDIRAAEQEVATESALIGVAVADYFPQFTLSGIISVNSRNLSSLFTDMSFAHNVGPSVNWNLLNYGRVKSNVAAQRARHEQALIRYQSAVLRAAGEVENSLVSYNREQERLRQLEQAVEAARDTVRISEATYEKGLIQFQPVLDAQRAALQLEEQLALSTGTVSLNLIRVYKALGGGWNTPFHVVKSLPSPSTEPQMLAENWPSEPWPRPEARESVELLPVDDQLEVEAYSPIENSNENRDSNDSGLSYETMELETPMHAGEHIEPQGPAIQATPSSTPEPVTPRLADSPQSRSTGGGDFYHLLRVQKDDFYRLLRAEKVASPGTPVIR